MSSSFTQVQLWSAENQDFCAKQQLQKTCTQSENDSDRKAVETPLVSGDRIDFISDVENAKAELQKKLLRQIYMLWGQNHPASFTYRKKHRTEQQ